MNCLHIEECKCNTVSSERPVTVFEDEHRTAVTRVGRDGQIGGADHKIFVDHRFVDTFGAAFFQCEGCEPFDAILESFAECQMTRGIFIKQRVVKQQFRLTDGGVVGNEGAFAEIGGTFIPGLVPILEMLQDLVRGLLENAHPLLTARVPLTEL